MELHRLISVLPREQNNHFQICGQLSHPDLWNSLRHVKVSFPPAGYLHIHLSPPLFFLTLLFHPSFPHLCRPPFFLTSLPPVVSHTQTHTFTFGSPQFLLPPLKIIPPSVSSGCRGYSLFPSSGACCAQTDCQQFNYSSSHPSIFPHVCTRRFDWLGSLLVTPPPLCDVLFFCLLTSFLPSFS